MRTRSVLLAVSLLSVQLAGPAAAHAEDSTFLLTTDDPAYRTPAFLGNGRLSLVTSPLGTNATPSFLAGLYDHAPSDVPRIAVLPAWNEIDLFNGESWLNELVPSRAAMHSYRQTVDMYTGSVRTSYEWVEGDKRTAVEVQAFVSRANPQLAAIRVQIIPRYTGRVAVSFPLRGREEPARLPLAKLERTQPDWGIDKLWYAGHMVVPGPDGEIGAAGDSLWMTSRPVGRKTLVAQAAVAQWPGQLSKPATRSRKADSLAAIEITFDAAPDQRYTFYKYVSVVSTHDTPRPLERARSIVRAARARGYTALFEEHARAWGRLWETDILVEGDPKLQRVVRAMTFYLLSSAREDVALGIPPMGLSSAGYYGHIFWDSDTWMFPALLLMHPDIARSLVMFRVRTLDAARRNARSNGYRGAMYPWEADELGRETTPYFANQNALYENHVTGDVALAQWQYYQATGDSAWLARHGYAVIHETAEFWLSRVTCDAARRPCDIRDVVSVDEGLIGVDNDAYTNAVAKKNLEMAAAAAKLLGRAVNPRWAQTAARLYIPYDSAGEYHPTYEGAPDSTLGSVVPLLNYPLQLSIGERAKRTDLENALQRLAERGAGAMMTVTLYPVIAAELGDRSLVDSLLPGTYQSHLRMPFYVLAETPRSEGVSFVTGAGGFLQQVIYGYSGLRLAEAGLVPKFKPVLPSRISRLVLRNFHIRGKRYDIVIDASGRRVIPRDKSK